MLQVKKSSFCGVSFFYEWNTSPDNSFQFFWVFSKNNFLGRGFLVSMGGGGCFSVGGPFTFKWGRNPMGLSVLMGEGVSPKNGKTCQVVSLSPMQMNAQRHSTLGESNMFFYTICWENMPWKNRQNLNWFPGCRVWIMLLMPWMKKFYFVTSNK